MQDELGFPYKPDNRRGWMPAELNNILKNHVVRNRDCCALRHLKASAFQYWFADTAAVDGCRGSNVYEVNQWLWQFGHCRPRLGGLSMSETEDRE